MFFLSQEFKSISADVVRSFDDAIKVRTDLNHISSDSIGTKPDTVFDDGMKLNGGDVNPSTNKTITDDILIGDDFD